MPRIKSKSRVTYRKSGSRFPAKAIRKVNRKRKASSLETAVHEILDEEGIKYIKEKTIGRCHADIFIAPRTVIELDGCFWHACPLCFPEPTKTQKAAILKDSCRYGFFRRLGFDVVRIWECELKNEPARVRRILKALAPD